MPRLACEVGPKDMDEEVPNMLSRTLAIDEAGGRLLQALEVCRSEVEAFREAGPGRAARRALHQPPDCEVHRMRTSRRRGRRRPVLGRCSRDRASASHSLCVNALVHLPRLHLAGTRLAINIACIVCHRARASSSPSLGRNALVHLHRMHCASWCLCIFLAFIGQERARPAASHALCDIVPVFLLAFIGQERARASAYHALCPATVVRTHMKTA